MSDTPAGPLGEIVDLDLPTFSGGPAARARQAALHFADRLRSGEIGRARSVLEDPEARRWVDKSLQILERVFPDDLVYLAATAAYFDSPVEALFASQHRSLFPPQPGIVPDDDGCSVGASRLPNAGAWIVKNRDNRPELLERHVVAQHIDPAWSGDAIVVTTSAGGPVAASGGINTRGFCVVSTAVLVDCPPPGIHRTVLMGGLLASCTTVDDALEIIGSVPHLGGTLTMGDASGAIATVELEPDAILIECAGSRPWVARTNHACSRSVTGGTMRPTEEHRSNSALRLGRMQRIMGDVSQLDQDWDAIEPWIASQMTDHDGADAVCRHGGDSITFATSIYTCDPPSMLISIGPGCEGRWGRWVHDPKS